MLEVLLAALTALVLLPVAVLFVQVIAALAPYKKHEILQVKRPQVAVLVPAHDEALVIADTLRSIAAQLGPRDRIVVVADNCTDDTAEIAAAASAEVIKRNDPQRRGKGYALDFGVRYLERKPAEVVVVIDADCELGLGAIDHLADLCDQTGRPVQASYLMRPSNGAGLRTRIAEFAWIVKNQVRPLGYHRLGLPCQLMGTGMAFPWPCLSTAPLASGDIVEDLTLGISLARSGKPPLFCPEALVTSYFPATDAGIIEQRTRWEHGHLGLILRHTAASIAEAVVSRNPNLMALTLDLCVPPLSLLAVVVLASFAGSTAFLAATNAALPFWLAMTASVMLCAAVFLSWLRYGRRTLSLTSLAYAPLYALSKMPIYLKFLVRRQVAWVRSKRGRD